MDEIFSKLKKFNLTPNQFYVLYSIKHNLKTENFINMSLELTRLKNDKWIKKDKIIESINFYGNCNYSRYLNNLIK